MKILGDLWGLRILMISAGDFRTWETHAGEVRLRIVSLVGSISVGRRFTSLVPLEIDSWNFGSAGDWIFYIFKVPLGVLTLRGIEFWKALRLGKSILRKLLLC